MFASDEHRMEGFMNSALKWFAPAERETAFERDDDDERSENTLETSGLPPQVQEFLALKAASGT
jgi:hypothetical protein